MNDLSQILKAGTLLIVEDGEYSDRSWAGPVRLLGDFQKSDLAEQFRTEWKPSNKWEDRPSPGDFLPWLVASGKAESVDNIESWHVGSYGDFDPS